MSKDIKTKDLLEIGKEMWDAHGEEVVSALKKTDLAKKGQGEDGMTDTTKEIVSTKSNKKAGTLSTVPTNSQGVMASIVELSQLSIETVRYVEEQETRREGIRAERDVAIARINAVSDSIKLYLEKTFDERSAFFAKLFESLDVAIHEGNTEKLSMILDNINSLAASSPFKNLADIGQVQQALSAGDTEWDI